MAPCIPDTPLLIAELARELALDLPVIDLSGLPAGPARRVIDSLAPENSEFDAGT